MRFAINSDIDRRARFIYFSDPGRIRKKRELKNIGEDSPRTDWNQKYTDYFTLIKEANGKLYFVDCWKPKNSGRIVLTKGVYGDCLNDSLKCPPYTNLDEETKMVLHLAAVREHYPPLSMLEILAGPTRPWIVMRGAVGGTFLLAAINGSLSGQYTGAAIAGFIVLVSEVIFNTAKYLSAGQGYYNTKSVKLGTKGVDSLIAER